jgi:hypothetical protein
VFEQKQQGIEGLVLAGRRDLFGHRQKTQKPLDIVHRQQPWVLAVGKGLKFR